MASRLVGRAGGMICACGEEQVAGLASGRRQRLACAGRSGGGVELWI
jgi:hypothetical protein